MTKVIWKKDFCLLFGVYFFSNLLLLLNTDGLYWDDWAMYYQDEATFLSFMQQIQHGIKGDFAWYLLHLGNGIFSFRLFVVCSIFLMGMAVYYILSSIKELTHQDVFYITIIIVFTFYIIIYFLFFLYFIIVFISYKRYIIF